MSSNTRRLRKLLRATDTRMLAVDDAPLFKIVTDAEALEKLHTGEWLLIARSRVENILQELEHNAVES